MTKTDQSETAALLDMDAISDDAKMLAAAWFGLGMKTKVTLHLRDSRPTERTQAAIDELVAGGVVAVAPFNDFGGRVYSPLVDCHPAFRWMGEMMHGEKADPDKVKAMSWQLTEPITEDESYDLMSPFGQGVWDKERRGRKLRDNLYDAVTQPSEYALWRKGHRAGSRA